MDDIRSDACNVILLTLTALAVPAAGASLLRSIEQGWVPVMGLHIVVLLLLGWTTLRRHRLSLAFRGTIVTAVPFAIAVGGMLTYGRGNGTLMFFISSCVVAGCFFPRRIALGVVALCVITLTTIFFGYRSGAIAMPYDPGSYDLSVLSWLTLVAGFIFAAAAPIIGLSALLQSLESERQRADEAVKVRSDFLAHMSHELRTPMAGLIGMAEVLKGTRLDAQQQTFVTTLMRAGRNLLAVLNDLLDFAKFETGNIPIDRRPFRISEEIKNTCALFETRAAEKGLAFTIELAPLMQDDVIGDSYRINHVLSNLLDNAIKFTERGAVTIRGNQTVREDGGLALTCAVVDTGIGLSPAQAAHIFEPFAQVDTSISRTYGGSGLGLAICRKLLKAMDGEIAVTSNLGSGSTFTIQVPLLAQLPESSARPDVLPARDKIPAEAGPQRDGKSVRLLVAYDDANMQILIDIMLPRMGYDVTVVHDGTAAIAAAAIDTYDCILIDMHMPVLDGPDAMRAIHAAEATKDALRRTPIIALTADLIPEHVASFLAAGAEAVVAKPVDWSALHARIQQVTQTNPRAVRAS